MTDPRILVAGSAYIHDEGLRELCKLWSRVVQHLDPSVDIVVIDSVSPFEPAVFLDWPCVQEGPAAFGVSDYRASKTQKWVYRFNENIGHLSRGGQDGAGRTFCKSIELGIEGDYDYVVIIETDLIFLRSITDICLRMGRNGTKIAALPQSQYNFPEFGVCFVNCNWAKDFQFVEKYDWVRATPWPIPEIRIMNIVKDYLMLLPLYGIRNDQGFVTADNMANIFPYGPIAWLTHANSINHYLKAITLNNIHLK